MLLYPQIYFVLRMPLDLHDKNKSCCSHTSAPFWIHISPAIAHLPFDRRIFSATKDKQLRLTVNTSKHLLQRCKKFIVPFFVIESVDLDGTKA